VDCNKITIDASEAIKNLRAIEEQISDQMKSTLQRQATMIQGQSVSDTEMENMIHQPQKA
jgi:hypothetical protein